MNYLLDTCVISEFIKAKPDVAVLRWIAEMHEQSLFLSAITVAEIQRGIAKLPKSKRKNELTAWFMDVLAQFEGRILSFDSKAALFWGNQLAKLEQAGRKMPTIDAFIASTAASQQMHLVTRNSADFKYFPIETVYPWS